MIVSAITSDTSTLTVSVSESAAKNCPATPSSAPSGRNTTTVVIVLDVTGQMSSWTATRIAAVRSVVKRRWRTMFSVITTASSITSPIAIAIAPSVIRLNVCPSTCIRNTVAASVSGIAVALIAVMRRCRRKSSSTITASAAPISIASRTELTASRTSDAWSYTGTSLTPGGNDLASCAAACATLSATATVFPPICRVMLMSAAALPSPATMRTWSSVPGITVATSRTRNAPRTTTFATSSAVCASCALTTRYCL